MLRSTILAAALCAALPATLAPLSALTSRAEAACLGPYNAVPDPVTCAPEAHARDFARLLLPGLKGQHGQDVGTLLGWVAGEILAQRDIAALPFTGIEVESTVKPSSVDIGAAVIAELRPGVSVSANVNYFGDDYVEDLQGTLGLGITF